MKDTITKKLEEFEESFSIVDSDPDEANRLKSFLRTALLEVQEEAWAQRGGFESAQKQRMYDAGVGVGFQQALDFVEGKIQHPINTVTLAVKNKQMLNPEWVLGKLSDLKNFISNLRIKK
jgi:hypothetical protein